MEFLTADAKLKTNPINENRKNIPCLVLLVRGTFGSITVNAYCQCR